MQESKETKNSDIKSLIIDDSKIDIGKTYTSSFYMTNVNRDQRFIYMIYSWIFQIIIWIYLLYAFYTKYFNYIIFGIIYIIYLLINLSMNKWFFLLCNIKTLDELFSEFFYSKIDIKFESYERICDKCCDNCCDICYDNFKIRKNEFDFPYYSYRDVSGLILLKNKVSQIKKSIKYFPVKLVLNIYFGDNITKKDYKELRDKFCNKYVDYNIIHFNEKITINNYETRYKEYEFLIKTENNFFISLLINIYA